MSLRAATRASALARWQTAHVSRLLAPHGVAVDPLLVTTEADRRQDLPISALGGKGMFVKEVQAAVLDGRADIAVHSAKDLPSQTHPGLVLAAVPERGDVRDALVGCELAALPVGARVATGSIRRRVQLAHLRPDLHFAELRGNIATRLDKADGFDAIVMASVALERLELTPEVVDHLAPDLMVPQVGQGALAVECRADDVTTSALLRRIEHGASRRAVDAERGFLAELGGDCDLPAGALALAADDTVSMTALLADTNGTVVLRSAGQGHDGVDLGRRLAIELRTRLAA